MLDKIFANYVQVRPWASSSPKRQKAMNSISLLHNHERIAIIARQGVIYNTEGGYEDSHQTLAMDAVEDIRYMQIEGWLTQDFMDIAEYLKDKELEMSHSARRCVAETEIHLVEYCEEAMLSGALYRDGNGPIGTLPPPRR